MPHPILILLPLGLALLIISLLIRKNNSTQESNLHHIIREASKENRQELTSALRETREEMHKQMLHVTQPLTENFQRTTQNQHQQAQLLQQKVEEGLRHILEVSHKASKENRQEIQKSLKELQDTLVQSMQSVNQLQREKFHILTSKQEELVRSTESKLEKVRQTVDEKLHKTLEERLGKSFQLVSHRLEAVQKGLGEMQQLAHDVGDLKTVLTKVKARGTLGEIQLGNILQEIMAPQQYATDVKTNPRLQERVEYAIKLPANNEETNTPIYLPIDAKFPHESHLQLQVAHEKGNPQLIEIATKKFLQSIKKSAKDIQEKYLAPPHTTDFGILFLSTESLFAEALRHPELITSLQRQHKVVITGPTTLAAMLNSLQVGFKTLAIQQRSSQVWEVLAAVKTEFNKFGNVLEKAQSKIQEANTQLDKLVGERTRVILSKLKKIETLPANEEEKK